MSRRRAGWCLTLIALAVLTAMIRMPAAAAPVPLADEELDAVYAEGLYFTLDMKLDVEGASAVRLEGGNLDDLQTLLNNGVSWTSAGIGNPANTVRAMVEPGGDLDLNALLGSIYIGGNALQNTHNLFNLVVQGGDVGVGINISIILNPVGSNFSVYNFNFNFSDVQGLVVGN